MINRAKTTLMLVPAIVLLFVWIAVAPSLREQASTVYLVSMAVLSATVTAWSISAFAHTLVKKE